MERLAGIKTSLGLSCPVAEAPTPKGSPERLWRTDATDPCTLASAPAVAPNGAARAPSWDSWKGGGAAEGAVLPAATTPCVERVCSTWWFTGSLMSWMRELLAMMELEVLVAWVTDVWCGINCC